MTNAEDYEEFGKRTLNPLRQVPQLEQSVAAQEKARFLRTAEQLSQQPQLRQNLPLYPQARGILASLRLGQSTLLFKVVVAILIVMVILAGSSFTVLAAQNSLPGDLLYAVKWWSEDARLSITSSTQSKLDLILTYTNRRASEISQLTAEGRNLPDQASERYQSELEAALQLAAEMNDSQIQKALGQIKNQAENQGMTLEELLSKLPAQAEPAIIHLQERLREQIDLTDFGEKNPQAFRSEMRLRQHGHPGTTKKTPGSEAGKPGATDATESHQPGEGNGGSSNDKQKSTQAPGHNNPGGDNSSPGNGKHIPEPTP